MAGCKKTIVTIAKRVGKEVGAGLIRFAVDVVTVVQEFVTEGGDPFTGSEKRTVAFNTIKARAVKEGKELPDRTLNLVLETAVEAVKGPDDESSIGIDDLANREEV